MNDPRLDDVARAVAAGEAVDWHDTEASGADSDSTALLRELHVIAGIASFHQASSRRLSHQTTVTVSNQWGALRILRSIGSGSFGDVYEAYDPALDRHVALKLLRSVERSGGSLAAEAIEEGRVLARVRHPHVVTVFGAARIDGRAGIWMELIPGSTLASRIKDSGRLDARAAASAGRDVCLGLAAIHDAGVLHRDVKAQNVMQDETGRIVLMDLGAGFDASGGSATLMAGTPAYLSPELLCGERATVQSDTYSVGVLLFHLTTGAFPVRAASLSELRAEHARGSRVTLRHANAAVPRSLASIIERALAPAPSDRFATARELADALDGFLRSHTRRWYAAVTGGSVAALGIAAAVAWGPWLKPPSEVAARRLILVGAFDNHTGKVLFDRTIQAGLEYELSPTVSVAPSVRVDDALKVMRQPIDSPLTPALAIEVARRDAGIRSVIVGSVDAERAGDVINAQIVDPATGVARTSLHVRVASDALAPEAVRELALELDQRLGGAHDIRRQRTGPAISLESQRDYSDALRLGGRGTWAGALEHARQATSRDHAFALAQIWQAWCEFKTGATNDALQTAAAAEAAAQDSQLPPHEREWILGRAAEIRGEADRTLAHYEGALQTQPDNFWIVNELALLYPAAGLIDRTVDMATAAAELRPNDFRLQANGTRWLLIAGRDAAQVRQSYARALRLFDAMADKPGGPDASLVLLAPAELAWRARDANATTTEIARVVNGPRLVAMGKSSTSLFPRVASLYLAMGQISSARTAIDRIGPADREAFLAVADYYAGDLPSQARHLGRLCDSRDAPTGNGHFVDCMRFLIESGHLRDTQDLLERAEAAHWDPTNATMRVLLGELASARHRPEEAIQILAGTIDRMDKGMRSYRGVRALSDAWLQKADWETAIKTLRSALSEPSYDPDPGADLEATALSFRLAALLRRTGATTDAAAIEETAIRGLERADAGFVDRLRALGAAGLDRK